jgi:hypothetical protein
MKVVICGDSYCTPSTRHRKHFGHLLHDVYGHDVINVAQGGVSMVAIALQIEEALNLLPDVVIYKNTHADRFEVPVVGYQKNSLIGRFNLSRHIPGERYMYHIENDDHNVKIVSDVVQNLLPNADPVYPAAHISDAQRNAIKNYWVEVFDYGLKTLTDHWIHQYWTGRIVQQGALAVDLSADGLGRELFEFTKKDSQYPEPYHTDPETQCLVAEKINQHLASWPGASYQLDHDKLAWRESVWKQLANR